MKAFKNKVILSYTSKQGVQDFYQRRYSSTIDRKHFILKLIDDPYCDFYFLDSNGLLSVTKNLVKLSFCILFVETSISFSEMEMSNKEEQLEQYLLSINAEAKDLPKHNIFTKSFKALKKILYSIFA